MKFNGEVTISIDDFDFLREKAAKYDEAVKAQAEAYRNLAEENRQRLRFMTYFTSACEEISRFTGTDMNEVMKRFTKNEVESDDAE